MNSIDLGVSKQTLFSILGSPVQETSESGQLSVWYASKSPSLADIYTFSNDALVFASQSYYKKPVILQDYVLTNGLPERSFIVRAFDTHDSLSRVIHIWPEKGLAVETIGSDMTSQVTREDTFAQTTLDMYLATWGKQYQAHETVTVSTQMFDQIQMRGMIGGGVMIVFVVLLCVGMVVFLKKRRKKLTQSSNETLP